MSVEKTNVTPTPPFWGTKCIESVPVPMLVPFINRVALYKVQWGFKSGKQSKEAYKAFVKTEVDPIFNRLVSENNQKKIIQAKAVYGYFPAQALGNELLIYDSPPHYKPLCQFSFPRQNGKRELCISDFFRSQDSGEYDVVAFQLVTVGQEASDYARTLFKAGSYQEYLFWHGFNVEMTEGLAEYIHKRIRGELGFGSEDARDMFEIFKQRYRGSRYSFGYPACPNLQEQRKILRILDADRIGVVMSEEDQLWPEESTSAIVVHHPQAKYFVV